MLKLHLTKSGTLTYLWRLWRTHKWWLPHLPGLTHGHQDVNYIQKSTITDVMAIKSRVTSLIHGYHFVSSRYDLDLDWKTPLPEIFHVQYHHSVGKYTMHNSIMSAVIQHVCLNGYQGHCKNIYNSIIIWFGGQKKRKKVTCEHSNAQYPHIFSMRNASNARHKC